MSSFKIIGPLLLTQVPARPCPPHLRDIQQSIGLSFSKCQAERKKKKIFLSTSSAVYISHIQIKTENGSRGMGGE